MGIGESVGLTQQPTSPQPCWWKFVSLTGRCGYVSKTQLLADTRLWACAYLSGARQIGATNNLLTHRVWSA